MILTNVKHVDELIDYLRFASLVKVSDDETLQLDSKGHFGDLRRSYEGANTYMASVTEPAAGQLQLVGAQAVRRSALPDLSAVRMQGFSAVGFSSTWGYSPQALQCQTFSLDRRQFRGKRPVSQ